MAPDFQSMTLARAAGLATQSVRRTDGDDRNLWRNVEWRQRREYFRLTGKPLPLTLHRA